MNTIETPKSANQLYKESGSKLTFAEWIAVEKQKGYFIKNDSLSSLLDDIKSDKSDELDLKENKKFLGLSKSIIILSTTIIGVAIVYKIYQTYKNK